MGSGKQLTVIAAIVLATPFGLAAGVAFAAEASGAVSPSTGSVPVSCPAAAPGTASAASGLDSSQVANARIIYDTGTGMGLPAPAAVIAIATAMQESGLRNLDYGDRDSVGLFQQRPSQGWGTPAQILDPVYAATAFYNALVKVPSWQSLPLTVAAQDVQHSGYPGAYAKWQDLATALVTQFTGTANPCTADSGRGVPATGAATLPAGFILPPGTPVAVQVAISYAVAQLGKPYIWGATGPEGYDCSGLIMMAYQTAGVDLPRTTYQQVDAGIPVYSLSQLQPGDLLFTAGSDGTPDNPGHVGMYIGSGTVIDAPQTGQDVELTPLTRYWQQATVAIRRIA
jgi:cell wall-associated NlpC family hydrolase